MLEQFIKSIFAYFIKVEPMSAYVQSIPVGVQYPCYLLNKADLRTRNLNAFYFINTVGLYIRVFDTDEVSLKNKVFNLTSNIFENRGKIPILNEDGTESERFIRIEDLDSYDLPVDANELYCIEINFNFDTTHQLTVPELDLLAKVKIVPTYN
jgi:hypothetical protein